MPTARWRNVGRPHGAAPTEGRTVRFGITLRHARGLRASYQRTYESLESEGYVYSVPGKGSFAAPHTGVDEGRKDALLRTFDQTAAELLFLGVEGTALWARIRAMEGREAQ